MALIDADRVLVELEAWLIADGRSSHGTGQILHKLAELRAQHRVQESAEAAVLRRFGEHLTDTFFGLLPSATDSPLDAADPDGTAAAMAAGAHIRSTPIQGDACQRRPVSGRAPSTTSRRRAAA